MLQGKAQKVQQCDSHLLLMTYPSPREFLIEYCFVLLFLSFNYKSERQLRAFWVLNDQVDLWYGSTYLCV